MLKRIGIFGIMSALTVGSSAAWAADMKASIAEMPVYAESKDKGVLVDFVKAIQKASGKSIDYQVVPFARSMNAVETSQVDFHMPLIEPIDAKGIKFTLSKETIFHVNFVLYSNKNKPVDPSNLDGKVIETDIAHIPYFPFKVVGSSSIEASLKKLDAGRIDGFIFADDATDSVLKQLGIKSIKRQLYKRFDVKVILPPKGFEATDKSLTETIGKLRSSGEYNKIMGVIDHAYNDWQP